MKTAKIPLYGNIALSAPQKDETLRCLEYMCSLLITIKTPRALSALATSVSLYRKNVQMYGITNYYVYIQERKLVRLRLPCPYVSGNT